MKPGFVVSCCTLMLLAVAHAGNAHGANADMKDEAWPSFGGQADEQRYSPLTQINDRNIGELGLAWYQDLPFQHAVSAPVAAEGKVFTATGHSLVSAFDAVTGKLLWRHDSGAAARAGSLKLRNGFGIRGLSYADGRIFVGTHDGRLLALDAKNGEPVWSVLTTEEGDNRFITGAPRAFAGRVLIGHAGADGAGARGYVTCYDTVTGRQLWRFHTVPGDPAKGFENETMEMAARTWHGQWWTYGAGGTAWNALTYDPEFNRFYIGVGNGFPFNQELRSEGKGDNLFLSSVVAVDADTGKYVWHYQTNPGEQWDYNATMDMTLATLTIAGEARKVLMTAPKNGFFYVLDRSTGKLISAAPFAKVTWAEKIDLESGRPVEHPGARDHGKELFEMWPSVRGAHNWLPQSFNPGTGLVYLPVLEEGRILGDKGIDLNKVPGPVNTLGGSGIYIDFTTDLPGSGRSFLKAWDPLTQQARWSIELPGDFPGGTMTTGGNLVFQGRIDHQFNAYAADSGKLLWSFDARSPVVAPPIAYSIDGRQYVTVLTGSGNAAGGLFAERIARIIQVDYRTMPRRVLTFSLGGTAKLPPAPPPPRVVAAQDPGFRPDQVVAGRGQMLFYMSGCANCHGMKLTPAGTAPDLRLSPTILDGGTFKSIVRDGALIPNGMPGFTELSDTDAEAIRQFLRSVAQTLPQAEPAARKTGQ